MGVPKSSLKYAKMLTVGRPINSCCYGTSPGDHPTIKFLCYWLKPIPDEVSTIRIDLKTLVQTLENYRFVPISIASNIRYTGMRQACTLLCI